MAYKLKNEATGQVGWQTYEKLSQARHQAKEAAKFHNAKVSVVDEFGNKLVHGFRANRRAGATMVMMFNINRYQGA